MWKSHLSVPISTCRLCTPGLQIEMYYWKKPNVQLLEVSKANGILKFQQFPKGLTGTLRNIWLLQLDSSITHNLAAPISPLPARLSAQGWPQHTAPRSACPAHTAGAFTHLCCWKGQTFLLTALRTGTLTCQLRLVTGIVWGLQWSAVNSAGWH